LPVARGSRRAAGPAHEKTSQGFVGSPTSCSGALKRIKWQHGPDK
jgi:hypothetical protein